MRQTCGSEGQAGSFLPLENVHFIFFLALIVIVLAVPTTVLTARALRDPPRSFHIARSCSLVLLVCNAVRYVAEAWQGALDAPRIRGRTTTRMVMRLGSSEPTNTACRLIRMHAKED